MEALSKNFSPFLVLHYALSAEYMVAHDDILLTLLPWEICQAFLSPADFFQNQLFFKTI